MALLTFAPVVVIRRAVGAGFIFQRRTCILSANYFYISTEAADMILDLIPLTEITEVAHVLVRDQEEEDLFRKSSSGVDKDEYAFYIHTREHGPCGGRAYVLKCNNVDDCDKWIHTTRLTINAAKAAEVPKRGFKYFREKAKLVYHSRPAQVLSATVIIGSFALAVVAAEILPEEDSTLAVLLDRMQSIFTFCPNPITQTQTISGAEKRGCVGVLLASPLFLLCWVRRCEVVRGERCGHAMRPRRGRRGR
eukprot:1110637-Rhodomonas_salina.1